ncbi:hypothetical protein D3C75_849630 [compost metagenome]
MQPLTDALQRKLAVIFGIDDGGDFIGQAAELLAHLLLHGVCHRINNFMYQQVFNLFRIADIQHSVVQLIVVLGQQDLDAQMLLQLYQVVHQSHQHNLKVQRAFVLADQLGQEGIQRLSNLLLIPQPDGVEQLRFQLSRIVEQDRTGNDHRDILIKDDRFLAEIQPLMQRLFAHLTGFFAPQQICI